MVGSQYDEAPARKPSITPLRLFLPFLWNHRSDFYLALKSSALPDGIFATLCQVLAAISLLFLAHNAFGFGLSSTIAIALSVYVHFVDLTVGVLDPAVKAIIVYFRDHFSLHFTFAPGWRYIFVILQLLFSRDAATAFHDKRYSLGIFRFCVGLIVAVTSSITLGAPLLPSTLSSNIVFCLVPVLGIFIYDIIMYFASATIFFSQVDAAEAGIDPTRRRFLSLGLQRSSVRLLIVSGASLMAFVFPSVRDYDFPSAGLLAVFFGLIANCAYWLVFGITFAAQEAQRGNTFDTAFQSSEAARFGVAVSRVLVWLLMFLMINAGGRLVNL